MNPILAYFDLNRRPSADPLPLSPKPVPSDDTGQSFPEVSISSAREFAYSAPFGKKKSKRRHVSTLSVPVWQQAVFYLGAVAGVLFSSSVMQFQTGKAITFSLTAITIVLSAIVALVLMPFIYRKAIRRRFPFHRSTRAFRTSRCLLVCGFYPDWQSLRMISNQLCYSCFIKGVN